MFRLQPYTTKITGTGAAIFVDVGFRPKHITAYNLTQNTTYTWTDTMADASAVAIAANGAQTNPTVNCFTSGSQGFTIGTDAGLNNNADVIHLVVA